MENLGDSDNTQFRQEYGDMLEGGQNPEGSTSPTNFENMGDELGDHNNQTRGGEDNSLNPQLQALLTTVMAAITSESAKLMSTIQNLKGELKAEIKQVAKDLTAQFEASQNKFREDMQAKLNSEILGVSTKITEVARNTASKISKISATVEVVQATMDAKVETQITEVKKYIDGKVKEVEGDRQLVNRNTEELVKVSDKIRELESKLTVGRPAKTQVVGPGNPKDLTANLDQNAGVAGSSASTNIIPPGSCDGLSDNTAAGASIVNQTVRSGVCDYVNATSETLARSVDLQELTLPTFNDSAKQVPLHFIRDLELYFKLKQIPDSLKLPLAFRAVQEPVAKQWFSSAYDRLGEYADFKKGFTDLLWNPNRQAGIRSKIYLDRHTPNAGETYVDHYIRYANLASTLDPPLQDADLLSALTAHYDPRVQQGLLCGNFKCTQEVLGYLSKVQSLQEDGVTGTICNRDSPRGEIIRRPHMGIRRDDRPRDRGSQVNVRAIHRQTGHPNGRYNDRRNGNTRSRDVYERSGGRLGEQTSDRLNRDDRPFDPQILTTVGDPSRNRPTPSNEAQSLN